MGEEHCTSLWHALSRPLSFMQTLSSSHFPPPTGKGSQGCKRSEQTEEPGFGQVALVSVHLGIAEACCMLGTGTIKGGQTGCVFLPSWRTQTSRSVMETICNRHMSVNVKFSVRNKYG